jgi:outer membrane protein assembly factor BamB
MVPWMIPMALAAATPSWPGYRGPNSAGTAADAQPPIKIGPKENVAWSVEVPPSPSSPTVWGDRLFLTTFNAGALETRAYATADGKLLWSRGVTPEKFEEYHLTEGSPAAGTAVTDGHVVASYFGSFGVIVHDLDGRELWRHRLPVAETAGNFGSGSSPLIHEGRVIVNRDHITGSSILAFDSKTGKKLWETARPDRVTSYGTPIVWRQGETTDVVVAGAITMRGYDPSTGVERWILHGLPAYTCTTPVIGDGLLFFAGWSPGKADSPWPSWESTVEKQDKNGDGWISMEEFGAGEAWFKVQDIDRNGRLDKADWDAIGGLMKRGENVLLAVKPGGKGDITQTHVAWKYTRGLPYVPCPLHLGDRLYIIRDGGLMTCVNPSTGQPHYAQERIGTTGSYYASPVGAEDRIYVASLDGKLTVVKAGGTKPEVLHTADFGERIAATPALVGKRLYLRTHTRLYAFQAP